MRSSQLGNAELCLRENSPAHSGRKEKKTKPRVRHKQKTSPHYTVSWAQASCMRQKSADKLIKMLHLTQIIFLPFAFVSEKEAAAQSSYLWFQVHQTDSFVVHLKNHILSPHFAFGIQQLQLSDPIVYREHCLFPVQNKGGQVLGNGTGVRKRTTPPSPTSPQCQHSNCKATAMLTAHE